MFGASRTSMAAVFCSHVASHLRILASILISQLKFNGSEQGCRQKPSDVANVGHPLQGYNCRSWLEDDGFQVGKLFQMSTVEDKGSYIFKVKQTKGPANLLCTFMYRCVSAFVHVCS